MAVFVDTGAWFAYFVRRDPDHAAAVDWTRKNRQPLVTTDYVIDELLTLLKLRESHRVAAAAGEALLQQNVAKVERITETDFRAAWEVFRQYRDKAWSFTDCTGIAYLTDQRNMSSSAIVQKLWNYCNVLRDDLSAPDCEPRSGRREATCLRAGRRRACLRVMHR